MNKEQERIYRNYMNSCDYKLYQAYGRPSIAKWKAWEYCHDLMESVGGHCLKVISHNAYMFTAGFEFMQDGERRFMYISPSGERDFGI